MNFIFVRQIPVGINVSTVDVIIIFSITMSRTALPIPRTKDLRSVTMIPAQEAGSDYQNVNHLYQAMLSLWSAWRTSDSLA
jgi:hypothetical protein